MLPTGQPALTHSLHYLFIFNRSPLFKHTPYSGCMLFTPCFLNKNSSLVLPSGFILHCSNRGGLSIYSHLLKEIAPRQISLEACGSFKANTDSKKHPEVWLKSNHFLSFNSLIFIHIVTPHTTPCVGACTHRYVLFICVYTHTHLCSLKIPDSLTY